MRSSPGAANAAPLHPQLTKLTIFIGTGILQVELSGELVRSNAPELVEAVALGLRSKMHVIVDCSRLTFIDAEGVRALLSAPRGSAVEVINLQGFPLRVIDRLKRSGQAAADLVRRWPPISEDKRCMSTPTTTQRS